MVWWIAVILGLIPASVWMIFFLQEDRERPEPKGLLFSTFLFGGLITLLALFLQQALLTYIIAPLGLENYSPFSLFWLAAIEEILKFMVVFVWVSRRHVFDEPIDAMIYLIVAGLGFSTVENIFSVSKTMNGFELVTLRFVGATLVHSLSSGLVGYYWAQAIVHGKQLFFSIFGGLFIATLVHTLFNGLILRYGPLFQATLFIAFVAFFVLHDFERLKKEERDHVCD